MVADGRALELIDLGDKLFSDKRTLDSLHQEIAYQFCPNLADFTTKLVLGQDYSVDRMDSYPEQMSRELTNQLAAMLRPNDRPWFKTTTLDQQIDAVEENARYLDYVTKTVRQALYDPRSNFIKATKQADEFYVNFGQAVLSCEEAPETRDHLFFRNFHIKDCVWMDNQKCQIDVLHRREMITARRMVQMFREDRLDPKIIETAEKKPHQEFELRVIVMPDEDYDLALDSGRRRKGRKKLPFVICYLDVQNQRVIREGGLPDFPYIVPRWHMFANSQYAFSPSVMMALPDARMAQMMNQIILEAGEKAVDPPLIAKQQVVLGEPNIQAGGISWVDLEHDANLKEALDAIRLEPDMKTAFAMRQDLREMLTKAFFVDKLQLPEPQKGMTAFEVGRRLEEHVRNLLPLFEPMQIEYNTRLLDKAYSTLLNMNAFKTQGENGTPPLPQVLASADVTWNFQSPIEQAQDQILVEYFKGSLELEQIGMQAGAKAPCVNVDVAMRDAVRGLGTPASWRLTDDEMQQKETQVAIQRQSQMAMQMLGGAGETGEKLGKAGQSLGLIPPPQKAAPAAQGAQQGGGSGGGAPMSAAIMKAIQGSAQGSPALAGSAGLPAPDVGDQGPAAGSNETPPAPWQTPQPNQVIQAGGEGGADFAKQLEAAGQQPEQGEGVPVTQLTPQGPSNDEVMYALQAIMHQLKRQAGEIQSLRDEISKPKKIQVVRDKGKIVGAAVGPSGHS